MQESGIIKVKGKHYFRELTWNQDVMDEYTTEVTSMRMKDNDNAQIEWKFAGKITGVPVSGIVTSDLALNVLTGRIEKQSDQVKLTGNPLGSAVYTLQKWLWAQKLQARQLGDSVCCRCPCMSLEHSSCITALHSLIVLPGHVYCLGNPMHHSRKAHRPHNVLHVQQITLDTKARQNDTFAGII